MGSQTAQNCAGAVAFADYAGYADLRSVRCSFIMPPLLTPFLAHAVCATFAVQTEATVDATYAYALVVCADGAAFATFTK